MSNLDSTAPPAAAAAAEMGTAERDSTIPPVSALNGTQKCKKKKIKKKKNKPRVQQELPPDFDSTAAAEVKGQVDAKGNEVEQEATDAAASALNGTQKCKKKKIKKAREQHEDSTVAAEVEGQLEANGNKVEEQEATDAAASSAMKGTPNCNEDDAKLKVSLMPEKEANTTVVSVSESTPKRNKRRKRKNKVHGQLGSAKTSSSVSIDIIVADESENGCTDVVEASGHADVNMDPINGDDPSSAQSKANDADVLLKNKDGNKGNKNCAENSSLLQERSAGRKRRRGKRKWAAANGGPDFSSDNGGIVAKRYNLRSSANHGLSCICASCLVEAHKEKIQNIYSPRGSLVRFQRKKLLILDLNGLLADINQDYNNAHLAHGKVRTKLVFRRPYCDDFLRFCFQNFELAIWSSRKRENVKSVVDILMRDLKQYLLFCWDMSYCTVTGCKTIDNEDKPLVLKELKKVWNKDEPNLPWDKGEFSPSNTLLVDDSPYKALCNPPNTAIFPEPYSYLNQRDDYSLGPGGELRVYLERIAAADNVQNFVRDNPFGQKSITESDPNWNFYVKIVDKMERQIVDKVEKEIVDKVKRS